MPEKKGLLVPPDDLEVGQVIAVPVRYFLPHAVLILNAWAAGAIACIPEPRLQLAAASFQRAAISSGTAVNRSASSP